MARKPQPWKVPPVIAGQVPPHDLDLEAVVLSAALLDEAALDSVADLTTEADFYSEANRLIWRAIASLHVAGDPVDVARVAGLLRATGEIQRVDVTYLGSIVDASPAVRNARHHAQVLHDLGWVRSWISACQKWAGIGYGPEAATRPTAYRETAARELTDLLDQTGGVELDTFRQVMTGVVNNIQQLSNSDQIPGLSTGIPKLNERTGGHLPGDLLTIAGRPGMGKTALAVNQVRAAASPEHDIYVWSGEMPKEQWAARIMAQEANLDTRRMRQGRLTEVEWRRLAAAAETMAKWNIWIDDEPGITPIAFRARARRVAMRAQTLGRTLVLAVADYLQLMSSDRGDNREQEVSEISRAQKHTAKLLAIPVIDLSQLNRGVELRVDKHPTLADLRESGAIEQDSDSVWFLFRPGYYLEQAGKVDDTEGRTELIIAKQRNGPTGSVLLKWWSGCAKFEQLNVSPWP